MSCPRDKHLKCTNDFRYSSLDGAICCSKCSSNSQPTLFFFLSFFKSKQTLLKCQIFCKERTQNLKHYFFFLLKDFIGACLFFFSFIYISWRLIWSITLKQEQRKIILSFLKFLLLCAQTFLDEAWRWASRGWIPALSQRALPSDLAASACRWEGQQEASSPWLSSNHYLLLACISSL